MSYSFTDENDETLMVPVADIFNHHSDNNAHLSFEDGDSLKMVSTKPIRKASSTHYHSFRLFTMIYTF